MVQIEKTTTATSQPNVSCKSASVEPSHFHASTNTNIEDMQTRLRATGQTLVKNPHDRQAYNTYRALLEQLPETAAGYNDLAIAMTKLGRQDHAEACFCQAIAHDPQQAHFHNNLGRLLREQGRTEDAIICYREAIRLEPQYANAQWNLALSLLALGQFREGWQRFSWRTRADLEAILDSQRNTQGQLWQGEPFPDRRLLIRYEQGCGDCIQMLRYLPMVKALGGTVVLETVPSLQPLFTGLPGVDVLVEAAPDGHPTTHFDSCAFALDLPRLLKTELHTIPNAIPYLKSDPDKRKVWQTRLAGPEQKIGVVWAGSPHHSNDSKRSCRADYFNSLAALPGVLLFSLQVGQATQELNPLIHHRIVDLSPFIKDFSDTAAIIDNLDLVVSVDTAVLHLAGALGRPVWGLLPYVADWRWLVDRDDSPWYPSMRLFRQACPDDWASVFSRVRLELQHLAAPS